MPYQASSPTVDLEEVEIDVELTGSADGLFTFDAVHAVLVEASDENTARASALPKEIRYGTSVPTMDGTSFIRAL